MSQGKKMSREEARLKGADKKNPQRYRTEPPKSSYELGDAPDFFTDDQKEIWAEIAQYSLPGVLTGAERFNMEVVTKLLDGFRKDTKGDYPPAKIALLNKILGQLGMNPLDRQRLGVQKPAGNKDKKTGFEEF